MAARSVRPQWNISTSSRCCCFNHASLSPADREQGVQFLVTHVTLSPNDYSCIDMNLSTEIRLKQDISRDPVMCQPWLWCTFYFGSACEEVLGSSPITTQLMVITVEICVSDSAVGNRTCWGNVLPLDCSLIGVWCLRQLYCSSFCLDFCLISASFWTACSCGAVSLSVTVVGHFVYLCIYL